MRLFTQRVSLIFFETEIMMKHGGYVGNISKWLQVAPTLFHEVKPGEFHWLVVLFLFLFSIIYGIILPTDFHMFQDG